MQTSIEILNVNLKLLIIFSLVLSYKTALSQTDTTTVYKNLATKKFYAVSLSSEGIDGKYKYKINEKRVSKSTYARYDSVWKNIESCQPCILKSYDVNDQLISESVAYTDCNVGWFKLYYPNGRVKLMGYYKENPIGNWDDVFNRGYCNVPNGQWTYFNEKGDTLYKEFWKDGELIKQVPEQRENSLYKVELMLNGIAIDTQVITINQISQINIITRFKNSHIDSTKIKVTLILGGGNKSRKKTVSLKKFKDMDVPRMLMNSGIRKTQRPVIQMLVQYKGVDCAFFNLNVKVPINN